MSQPPDLPGSPLDLQSGSPQSKAEQTDPLDELARVIRFTRGAPEAGGEKPMGGAR